MIPHQQRWFKISEVQLTSLRKGWTHTSLEDKKGILQTVEEDQMIDCGCVSHSDFKSETDMLKEKYRQLMAASINNENPGWVQIAEIEKILNPFGTIVPDIENLQEFPFRSNPKKDYKSCKQEEQK